MSIIKVPDQYRNLPAFWTTMMPNQRTFLAFAACLLLGQICTALDHRYISSTALTTLTAELSQELCSSWNQTGPCAYQNLDTIYTYLHAHQTIVDASGFPDSVVSKRTNVPAWHGAGGSFGALTQRLKTEYTEAAVLAIRNHRYPEARVLVGQTLHLIQHDAPEDGNTTVQQSVDILKGIMETVGNGAFMKFLGIRLAKDLVLVVDVTSEEAMQRLQAINFRLQAMNDTLSDDGIRIILTLFTKTQIQPTVVFNTFQSAAEHVDSLMDDCLQKQNICREIITAGEQSALPLRAVRSAAEIADDLFTIFLFFSHEIDYRIQSRLHSAVLFHKHQKLIVIGNQDNNETHGYFNIARKTGGYAVFFPSASPSTNELFGITELFYSPMNGHEAAPFYIRDNVTELNATIDLAVTGTYVMCSLTGMAGSMFEEEYEPNNDALNTKPASNISATHINLNAVSGRVRFSVKTNLPGWSVRCYDPSITRNYIGIYRKETHREQAVYVPLQGQPISGEQLTVLVHRSEEPETIPSLEILAQDGLTVSSVIQFTKLRNSSELCAEFEVSKEPFWLRIAFNGSCQYYERPLTPTKFNASFEFFRPVEFLPPGGFVKLSHQFSTNGSYFVQLAIDDSLGYRATGEFADIENGGFGGNGIFWDTSNITVPATASLGTVDYVVFMMNTFLSGDETFAVQSILIANASIPAPPNCEILSSNYLDQCSEHYPTSLECKDRLWHAVMDITDEYDAFAYNSQIMVTDTRFNGTGFYTAGVMYPAFRGAPNRTMTMNSDCCVVEQRYTADDANGIEGQACVFRHPRYEDSTEQPNAAGRCQRRSSFEMFALAAILVLLKW